MTRILLIGTDDVTLRVDLLGYETASQALSSYTIAEPYANTIAVDTISIGAAVALLNDLNWYLARLVDDALVLEPSVTPAEWLSRDLATAIRNEVVEPTETTDHLKIYGIVNPEDGPPWLTEPMYAQRVGDTIPDYDLRDIDDTLVVRVTANEFGE